MKTKWKNIHWTSPFCFFWFFIKNYEIFFLEKNSIVRLWNEYRERERERERETETEKIQYFKTRFYHDKPKKIESINQLNIFQIQCVSRDGFLGYFCEINGLTGKQKDYSLYWNQQRDIFLSAFHGLYFSQKGQTWISYTLKISVHLHIVVSHIWILSIMFIITLHTSHIYHRQLSSWVR